MEKMHVRVKGTMSARKLINQVSSLFNLFSSFPKLIVISVMREFEGVSSALSVL